MSDHDWQRSILQAIGTRMEIFAELHPRPYLLFMTGFALLSYACLLLFPLLTAAGVAGVYLALAATPDVAWQSMLVWMLLATICGLVSYGLFRLRYPLPAGVVLAGRHAPALFQLVEDTRVPYASPRIDRIVITGEYQLDIVNTPLHVLPLRSTRTLLIGLPLLQCLSMTRFQCMLARRLGQTSGRSNRLLNWLNSLRLVWSGYREAAAGAGPACLPAHAVFSLFATLYTVLSTVAARLDELEADSYAMELFSDEDVLDAITTDAVYRLFLRERYWPAIRKLHEQNAALITNAHMRIPAVLNAGLQAGNIHRYVEAAMLAEQQWDDPWPSLVRRVENIGHAQACIATDITEPAAAAYLDTSRLKLEAALEAVPQPQFLQSQLWPDAMVAMRGKLRALVNGLPLWLKNMLHPREHAGELKR